MAVKETKPGKEPDQNVTHKFMGDAMDKIHSLFGGKGEDRPETSPEYHNRRTNEELKGAGMEDEHASMDKQSDGGITHPALKVIMAKLKMLPDEDKPAKGGYVGMSKTI